MQRNQSFVFRLETADDIDNMPGPSTLPETPVQRTKKAKKSTPRHNDDTSEILEAIQRMESNEEKYQKETSERDEKFLAIFQKMSDSFSRFVDKLE